MNRPTLLLLILAAVMAAGGVFWYVRQRGYQDASPSTPSTTMPRVTEPEEEPPVYDVLGYTSTSSSTEIFTTSLLDAKRRILFTDADEQLKIRYVKRVTADGRLALGYFAKKGEQAPKILGTIATDGTGKMTTLLDNFGSAEAPILSPDGKKVAYIVFSNADPDYGYQLLIMNTDGSNKRRLAKRETLITQLAFSPDGKKIAYATDTGQGMSIQTIATDGSSEAVTIAEYSGEIIYDLFWGDEIYFGKRPKEDTRANEGEIYRLKAEGTGLARLTNNDAYDGTPVPSPDGASLALVRTTFEGGKFSSAGELNLIVMTLADSTERELGQADGVLGWKSGDDGSTP